MPGGHHPRGAVEHRAEIVPVAQLGLTGRDAHPHRQLRAPLRRDRRVDRRPRRRERRDHTITGVAEQEAVVRLDRGRASTSSCAASAARIASASASHRRVDPSISVNRNVTTPEGADTRTECHRRLRLWSCSARNHDRQRKFESGLGVVEKIRSDGRLGVGNALLFRLAVGHRQQPPNPARHSIFRHRRIGEPTELLQRRLPMFDAQLARGRQVVRAPCRRGSPAPAPPVPPPPPRPGPIAAGSRRRSSPAGWRSPAPRGASAALPTSAACPGRPSGSATRRWPLRRAPRRGRLPRTSRAFALTPSRRAAPTSASAASGPGQLTSSADDRPGSVSEPWARNAPRQAASASATLPPTT